MSITPIWPRTNNEGDKIADISGTYESIRINKEPLNTPAIVARKYPIIDIIIIGVWIC